MSKELDFRIKNLGRCTIPSPMPYSSKYGDEIANFVEDSDTILYDITSRNLQKFDTIPPQLMIEKAGPRKTIYFAPSHSKAAIVTCGGLCPGLNDVIRSLVRTLWYWYGVKRIVGIPYGYQGFLSDGEPPIDLNPSNVDDIHNNGGSMLGSARGGGKDVTPIVDALERLNVNLFFPIGGDGTQRAANEISEEAEKRGLKLSVVGIPKTIDNDLNYIQRSFGFETAVAHAFQAVIAAHVEAKCGVNGIGLVKVMGRESGFIAAHTAMASNEVNFVLIPEVPFDLEGKEGFLRALEKRLDQRGHAVILVAEGAGQHLLGNREVRDETKNKKLEDIGFFLKEAIQNHFKALKKSVNLKYIDPSYMIRAAKANPGDSIYCARLGANAAHAAMAGKTGLLISEWNNTVVHIPISIATKERNFINPESALWRDVLETTRQPIRMLNKDKSNKDS